MPARQPHAATVPARVGWLLTAAVVLAHVMVLRGVAENLSMPDTAATRVFSTRSIQVVPPDAAPDVLPRQPASPAPPPRPEPRPARVQRPRTNGVFSAAMPLAPTPALPPPDVVEPLPADLAIAQPAPPQSAASAPEPLSATSGPKPVDAKDTAVAVSSPPAASVAAAATAAASEAPSAPAVAPPTVSPAEATRPLTIPGSVRLAFDAVGKRGRFDYRAMGDLIWLQDGDNYEMRLEMGDWIIGKRVLSSTGKLTARGLAPTRFSDRFRSERAAHFDREQGRIVFSANTPQAELMPGAQDQLSIFAQLAALVAGDPLAFAIGTTLAIQTAGPRDAEPWIWSVEHKETLELPGGQLPALKLERKPTRDYGQRVELWLAPELAFLPARIRVTFANGDFIDQQWKSSRPP